MEKRSLFYNVAEGTCRRDEIYSYILSRGLHRIRDAAFSGDAKHCEIEAEHLHNIPTYIAGGDDAQHAYYYVVERPYYLKHIDQSSEANRWLLDTYEPLWKELEGLIPIRGTSWEKEWIEQKMQSKYPGR